MNQKLVVAVVFVCGMFMNVMDITIVNVALPTLAREFDVGTNSIEWVVVGYLLSLAVWIPASGWIGDRFGTKRTYLFALGMFVAASLLCAIATSITQIIIFRMLQGLGGGMLTPVGTAMLFRAFPPEERARASRILIIPTVIAPATGPVLGGLLVDHLSWRWIFVVNLPIGLIALAFGLLFLEEHREPLAGRFDVPGFVLSGGGLALVLYALHEGSRGRWSSATVVLSLTGGAAALALLCVVELRIAEPMLKLRLLTDRLFRTANLVSLFAYGSFLGVLFLTPIFLQEVRGVSALRSGLSTSPEALGVLVSSQIAGRLYLHVGPRRLMVGGLVGLSIAMLSCTQLGLTTNLWIVRLIMFLVGATMANVFIPLQAATFATITPAETGRASAIFSTQRQFSAALGVAILATVLTARLPAAGAAASAQLPAFHTAFAVAGLMALGGAAVALTVHDSDAAATMKRPATVDQSSGVLSSPMAKP